jgi:hypothetical protein
MIQDGEGNGILVPTGKPEPALEVSFDISHEEVETKSPGDRAVKHRMAIVHFICCRDSQSSPSGDWDLLIGDHLLRLRHTNSDPEWLVLSSNA